MNIHTCECTILILGLLRFGISHQYNIKNNTGWLFFIALNFIDRFVWYRSVFTHYSYYRDFFCSRPELRLLDCHYHGRVRYTNTTNITVWCMSSILIDMTYFYVYTICNSEHYRVIFSYIPTPGQQVSAILWNITITVGFKSQVHRVTYFFFKCLTILHRKNT